MAEEMEIIIEQHDLGPPESEFGISGDDLKLFAADGKTVRVQVFIDGESVKPQRKTDKSVSIKRPSSPDGGTSTVVVTADDGEMLNVLRYEGNKKIPVQDPADDESTLNDIAKALKRIADAMPPVRNR